MFLSPLTYTPLWDCKASSRRRCDISSEVCIPAIAVWIREIPSEVFFRADPIPLSWLTILLDTARPAASSADEFTRKPEDRRKAAVSTLRWTNCAARAAIKAPVLVFMLTIVSYPLQNQQTTQMARYLGFLRKNSWLSSTHGYFKLRQIQACRLTGSRPSYDRPEPLY